MVIVLHGNIPDLLFSNAPIHGITLAEISLVNADVYYPPFAVTFYGSLKTAASQSCIYYSFRKGDYFGLYEYFEDYNWRPILEDVSADSAAKSFTAAVKNEIDQFVPQRSSKPRKYPAWYSNI